MIDARDLTLHIHGKPILENVSVQLHEGELTAIMGANGAGKTSLLSVLCGDQPATRGHVCYHDINIDDFSRKQLARTRAVMPQHSPMNFPFSAWEVVAMGRTPYAQASRRQEHQQALQCMAMTDTENFAEQAFPTLSGGEKQRVQLARVLNQLLSSESSHRYLFLDECTASLDPAHQHAVFQLLSKLTKQNIAVITIVHDINLASQYCDRIIMLKNGRIRYDLPTHRAITPEHLGDVFNLRTVNITHPEGDWKVVAAAADAVIRTHKDLRIL
ncbi:heme ABC transporter ATP-binding protein [Gynuella sunshinyii]|uniref:ABC-type hemin transport system, ATPase component n=1 Tax=Gynuella sunshinyii YC6258 TaxID=1445510 RepID=A0A0C5VKS6_9GAMM|nr:heme ABC transporter ATP-binding protein [Gynuella sunshinyii]AJQ94906.1 ABC-type hemin transport system, ATPase component [Gynuella sunshinyii YC6258]